MANLDGLEQAYRFYQTVKNDKETSVVCGAYRDAMEWIFEELAELFDAD